jgi:hypothetical protein
MRNSMAVVDMPSLTVEIRSAPVMPATALDLFGDLTNSARRPRLGDADRPGHVDIGKRVIGRALKDCHQGTTTRQSQGSARWGCGWPKLKSSSVCLSVGFCGDGIDLVAVAPKNRLWSRQSPTARPVSTSTQPPSRMPKQGCG